MIYLKTTLIRGLAILGCIAIMMMGCTTPEQELLEAGFAEVEITPLGGTVYLPLKAKAMVLKQGKEKIALVVCDIIGIDQKTADEVRKTISEKTGIPVGHISISATHTHSGGRCDDLEARIVQAVIEADKVLKPVAVSSGITPQEGLAFNRRHLMIDGTVRMNPGIDKATGTSYENGHPFMNPEIIRQVGPVDTDLHILFFRNKDDNEPVGSLTCFAMHTCVAGPRYSADYPGFLANKLSESYGNDFISIFGEGTCGDINHWDVTKPGLEGQHGPQRALEIGFEIAETIKKAVPSLSPCTPSLKVLNRVINIPLNPVTEMDVAWAKSATENNFSDFDSRGKFLAGVRARKILRLDELRKSSDVMPLEVQVFRIDRQTAIVTLPGEIFVEHGLAIKGKSPFMNTIIIELANASCGYVPTIKNYSEGGYEVVSSLLAPGGGEMLVAAAIDMLDQLKP
ncbi:MAG: hypothetical protein ACUVTX_02165 [Bacteroidales bacterium]